MNPPEGTRAIGASRTRIVLTVVVAAVLAAAAVLAVIVVLHVLTVMSEAAAHGYASYWDSVGQQVQQAKGQQP
jgi:lipopolysaccharide export LptBFGC system permease protein LptF